MTNLLLDESPLMVLPGLAKAIGLEEAVVLQQIHWLLSRSKNERDGKTWVYNTYADWNRGHFPWMPDSSMRRVFDKLRKLGLIVSTDKYNESKSDRTLWYTVNYGVVAQLSESENGLLKMSNSRLAQNEQQVYQETTQENSYIQGVAKSTDTNAVQRERFEKFWTKYRRTAGTSRQKAWESWLKINPDDALFTEIGWALEAYNNYWEAEGTEDRFIPHPVTWLNQERWNNPPTSAMIAEAKNKKKPSNVVVTNSGARRKFVG